jgi:hypothetical protein
MLGGAGIPVMEWVTVISQRPSLTLRGVMPSTAQSATVEKTMMTQTKFFDGTDNLLACD